MITLKWERIAADDNPAADGILEQCRIDALPENTEYRDDGCEYCPSCLECPFAKCRYDSRAGVRSLRVSQREQDCIELREAGATVAQIAVALSISRRSVFPAFARARAVS